jgi:aminoglycoside 6-adenylyltransferase
MPDYTNCMSYQQIETNFLGWARNETNIRAAIVIGSRARTHKPADQWSDLDIIFFTTTPDAYYNNSEWLAEMGDVWLQVRNLALAGSPEWLVVYRGGFKVDFLIGPATDQLHRLVQNDIYKPALRRGYRILFDKDESGAEAIDSPYEPYCLERPAPAEFAEVVSRLLLFAERTAKVLSRGELWRSKQLVDTRLKHYLLRLLEWHACAVHGEKHDIWRNGRFLHEWIHPDAARALPHTFATYDIEDMWRALLATAELGCWLAQETAVLWEFDYPYQTEQEIVAWIHNLHAQAGYA